MDLSAACKRLLGGLVAQEAALPPLSTRRSPSSRKVLLIQCVQYKALMISLGQFSWDDDLAAVAGGDLQSGFRTMPTQHCYA